MSASEKSLNPEIATIETLGIIAGGGSIPAKLVQACENLGIQPFIVALEGNAAPELVEGHEHVWSRLGAAGQIIKTLKAHEITDLVLIGSIHRPSITEIKPDLKTAEFLAKVGLCALGDSDILDAVRRFLESEGFRVHGVHKFARDLLAPEGVIGKYEPSKAEWSDIRRGIEISQAIGRLDIGQAVIIQEGLVLGVEGIEGTDELIERCGALMRKGRKPILVKTCKPQQDEDLDLPTIGVDTIEKAAYAGLGGVVIHAGRSLLYEREEVQVAADKNKLFVIGVDPLAETHKDG